MHRKAVYGHVMALLEDRDGPQQSYCRDLRADRGWRGTETNARAGASWKGCGTRVRTVEEEEEPEE